MEFVLPIGTTTYQSRRHEQLRRREYFGVLPDFEDEPTRPQVAMTTCNGEPADEVKPSRHSRIGIYYKRPPGLRARHALGDLSGASDTSNADYVPEPPFTRHQDNRLRLGLTVQSRLRPRWGRLGGDGRNASLAPTRALEDVELKNRRLTQVPKKKQRVNVYQTEPSPRLRKRLLTTEKPPNGTGNRNNADDAYSVVGEKDTILLNNPIALFSPATSQDCRLWNMQEAKTTRSLNSVLRDPDKMNLRIRPHFLLTHQKFYVIQPARYRSEVRIDFRRRLADEASLDDSRFDDVFSEDGGLTLAKLEAEADAKRMEEENEEEEDVASVKAIPCRGVASPDSDNSLKKCQIGQFKVNIGQGLSHRLQQRPKRDAKAQKHADEVDKQSRAYSTTLRSRGFKMQRTRFYNGGHGAGDNCGLDDGSEENFSVVRQLGRCVSGELSQQINPTRQLNAFCDSSQSHHIFSGSGISQCGQFDYQKSISNASPEEVSKGEMFPRLSDCETLVDKALEKKMCEREIQTELSGMQFDLASLNEHDRCPEQKVLRTVLKSNPMNASPSSDMEQPDDESTKVNLISQVVNKSSGLNDTKEAVLVPTSGHSHPVTVDEVDVSNGSQSQIGYMMCVNETELKLGGYRETTSTQLTPCSSPASRHHEPDGRLMSQAPLHIVASALNLGEGLEPTTIEPYCSVRSLASSSKGRTLSCLEAIGKLSRSVMVEKWEDQKVSSGFATNFPHFTKSNSTKLDPTITWRLQGSILTPSSGSLMPDFKRQISTGLASRRPSLQQSEAGGTANSESLVYSVLPPFLSSVQLSGPEEVITCSTDRPGFSSLSVDAMNLIAAKQAEPPTTDLDPGVTVGLELGTDEKSTSGRLMTAWQSMRELYAEGAGDPTEQIRRKRDQGVTDLLNLDDRHMATSIVAVSLAEGLQGLQGGSGDQTTGLLETSDMEWAHSTAVYAGDEGGRCWPTPLRRHRLRTAISLDSILLAQEESQTRRGFLKGKDTNKLTNDVCLIATQSEQTIPIRLYAESFGATLALQLKHSLNRQNSESIKSNLAVSLEGNRGATTLCSIIYESPSVQHSPFALEVTAWPGRCVQAELTKTYSDGNITKIVDRCENVEDVSKASSRSDLVNLGCPACTEERMKETLGRLRGQADSLSSLSSPPQTGAYVYTGSPSDANSECSCYHQLNEADIENGPNRVVPMDEVQPKGETQESGKLGQIGKMGKLGKLSKLNKSGIFGKFAQSVSEAKKMEVGLKVMHSLADTENLPARDKFATNKSAACEDSPILGFSQSVFPEKRCSPKSRKSVEQIVQLLAVQETRSVFQEWLVEQVAKTISRQNRHQSGPQTISNDAVGDCATESSCASTCCSLGNQPARRLVRGQKQYFPKTLPTSFDSGSDCCPGLGSGCGSVLASTSASVCCSDCDSGTGSEPSTPAIFTANYAGQKAKLNYPIDDISYDETVVNNCPRCLAEGEHQKVGPGMKVHHKQTFAEETGLWKPIVQEEDEFSDETILVAESLASESLEEECTSCESDEEALGNLQETIKNSGQQTHEPKWPHLKRKSAEKEDTTKCRSLYLKNRQKKIKGQTKTNGMWTREHENRIIKGSIKVRTAINGVSSLDEPHMAANAHKKEAAMKEVTHIYPSSQIPRLQNLGENNRESFKKSQIDKKLENQRLVASGKAEVWRETRLNRLSHENICDNNHEAKRQVDKVCQSQIPEQPTTCHNGLPDIPGSVNRPSRPQHGPVTGVTTTGPEPLSTSPQTQSPIQIQSTLPATSTLSLSQSRQRSLNQRIRNQSQLHMQRHQLHQQLSHQPQQAVSIQPQSLSTIHFPSGQELPDQPLQRQQKQPNANPSVPTGDTGIVTAKDTIKAPFPSTESCPSVTKGQLHKYAYERLFQLGPYDDLVKSHLNPADRRIKAVAAKNGCYIGITGPKLIHPDLDSAGGFQASRARITYQCCVAGPTGDKVNKCLNYLKETFPNSFLRITFRC